ncbi:MAG TPA: HAD-IIB family hydrolase [Gemmatimonadaceae bacterium]|nr:HAD-IIB family hydrolase [Gemmatimonadaceae bacterium]
MRRLVVVTDLDGTLLDARTYSTAAAGPALAALRARGVPLVLCTSKTRAEVEPLHGSLGLRAPFIVENGGAIVAPAGAWPAERAPGAPAGEPGEDGTGDAVIALGTAYTDVVAALAAAAAESGARVRGFHDMTEAEVAAATGLPSADAGRARQREYGEAFTVLDAAREPALLAALERRGFRWAIGGRFHHVFAGNDKGEAVRRVLARYRRAWPGLASAGLGDAPNDISMLCEVDRPVIVRGRHVDVMHERVPGAVVTAEEGPAGWNTAVLALLEEFDR